MSGPAPTGKIRPESIRRNGTSSGVSRGKAPERAGEAVVFVGSECETAEPTDTTRPNDPSGRMSQGKAPERAGEAVVFVGPGSLGRVDLVDSTGSPSVSWLGGSCGVGRNGLHSNMNGRARRYDQSARVQAADYR